MSTGHYHRRWSANTAGRTTPTSQTLASSVEPSTYGTSWNSVRWNKPSKVGYRSQSSTIAAQLEAKPYPTTSSRYKTTTNDATTRATQQASLGPFVTARSSCFDTSVQDANSKYRSEARELLNKWTNRERNGAEHSYLTKPMDNPAASGYLNKANEYPYRKTVSSITASRSAAPTTSRFSSYNRNFLSPSPVPQPHIPRAERPWRQRLAESSRIRASLGDDVCTSYSAVRNSYARSRRNSLSQASGDELSESVGRLRSYINTSGNRSREGSACGSRTFGSTSHGLRTPLHTQSYSRTNAVNPPHTIFMSRSCSPVRPRHVVFKSLTSTEVPSLLNSKLPDVLSDSQKSSRVKKSHESLTGLPMVSKSSSIRDNSCKRDGERPRKKTSQERTARRNSRQVGLTPSSSSSDEAFDTSLTRADVKRRRRRRRDSTKSVAPPSAGASDTGMPKTADTSISQGRNGSDAKDCSRSILHAASTDVISTASSSVSIIVLNENDSSLKSERINCEKSPDRSQISDLRSDGVSSLAVNISQASSEKMNAPNKSKKRRTAVKIDRTTVVPTKSSDSGSVDDLIASAEETDASSILDDESHYSAIVHFKPSKANTKRIAKVPPVPGLWKVANADEFISKNKQLVRPPCEEATTDVWTVRPRDAVRKILILPKRCAALNDVNKKGIAKAVHPGKNDNKKDEKKEINEVVEDQELNKKTSRIKRLLAMKSKPTEQKSEKKTEVIEENKKFTKEVELVPSKIKDEVEQVNKSQSRGVKGVGEAEQKTPQPIAVKPKAKQEQPKEESVETLVNLKSKVVNLQEVTTVRELPVRLSFKHPQRIREKKPLVTESVTGIFSKKPAKLTFAKTLVEKRKSISSTSYSCKEYSKKRTACNCELVRKSQQHKAQVTVDTPIPGVNTCCVRLTVKRAKKNLPTRSGSVATAKKCASRDNERTHPLPNTTSSSSQHLADAVVLDYAKGDEKRHERSPISRLAIGGEYNSAGCLVLPDKSLLEEYVNSKRGRLGDEERVLVGNEPRCGSPPNSIANEILPACAVRVFECSPHEVPVITAPSKSVSRLSSGCSAEHTTTPTVMLDTLTSYNNYNSTPQGFLRDGNTRIQIAKPIAFDTPKTPFEERVQQQANAIRKAAATAAATTANDGMDRHHSPRRGSISFDGMTALSTSFTAAIAANANHGRHERYAAHIPVNRGDNSGQQNVITQDSQQSDALDNATKQLDHVIDQARHKHSQHRSKFKEAIDYLDQIFEDLKKECDPGDDKGNAKERKQPITQPQAVSQGDVIRRPSIIHPSNSKTTTNSSNRITRQPKQDQQSSATEVIVPPSVVVESEPSEFNVAETVVLPKRTDKLDFTRRWLRDDLSSLAHQPPTPIMLMPEPCSYYNDVDEHSLGSCSAEVAAINLNGRRDKPKKSNGISKTNSLEKPALIRPQPYRPQPVFATPERNSGPRNIHCELEVPNIPRVASFDHVPERRDYPQNTWRSGSQEPHQGSVTSDDPLRPSPSAFQSVSNFAPRGTSTRGSLRSLPDAGLIIRGRYQQQQQTTTKDPSLAIDQLCAELELNTEHPLTTNDKRRSFPTSYGHENLYITGNSFYEQPLRVNENKAQSNQCRQQQGGQYRGAVSTHQSHSTTMNNSHRLPRVTTQQQPVQHALQSIQRSPQVPQHMNHPVARKESHRHQKSLDEVTNMLNNVVNDFHSAQPLRKRSQQSHVLYATPHSTNQSNPFETINQEKINPSRVEAMHNMFERNTAPVHYKWNPQPYPVRLREDDAYHEISEFSNRYPKRASPPRQSVRVHHSPQSYTTTEFIPAYPTTQPPSHPPGRNGSATSSQNGGYYSSNSSGISAAACQNNQIAARRGSIGGHQSASSRAASVADDEDDGFYDNIGTFDDRRFSRSSEMDVTSLSSHQLPPSGWKPTKIGSFLRKFGGGSRPPGSAASLVSLNKVANETPINSGNLMKSNSLSNEPWKKMVIDGPSIPARESTPSKGGFRTRIKNSIFGSKRRLNG